MSGIQGIALLSLAPEVVFAFRHTPGGSHFTWFVDTILRTHCAEFGLPNSEFDTTVRTNVPDGGADTVIHQATANDPSNLFDTPTLWQYKATDQSRINDSALTEEVNKHLAKEYIERGYAYRLCLCDDLDADKKKDLLEKLSELTKAINPSSPQPKILTASELAIWGSDYIGVVM